MNVAVLNTSQIVPVTAPPIANGAMLVRDGRIVAIGLQTEIEPRITDETVIDAGGHIVLPGFVDAHTHPVSAGNRAEENDPRTQGITSPETAAKGGGPPPPARRPREAPEAAPLEAPRRYQTWFLRGGTT